MAEEDPPEERPAIGPRLLTPEDWSDDWAAGVKAMRDRWKKRVLKPKKDPVAEAIKNEGKWRDRLEEAIREGRFAKKLRKVGFEGWANMVAVTEAREYEDGATKRKAKFLGITKELQSIRLYAVQKLDAMPTVTDTDRERKLLAARKVQLIIGAFSKGVITEAEARGKIDAVTAVR